VDHPNNYVSYHELMCYMNCCAGISKYLRHSESVAEKHYEFAQVEQSARNRAAVLSLIGGKATIIASK